MIFTSVRGYFSACLILISVPVFATNSVSADESPLDPPVVTPSDVFQQAEWVIAEIAIIRAHMDVAGTVRVPGVQTGKKPLHVYAKSLEVLEKIARSQNKIGVPPVGLAQIPLRKITPADVLSLNKTILAELGKIKQKLNISQIAPRPVWIEGKKPSEVYERMWRASYLLDGVAGSINPSFVYRNTQIVIGELVKVASKLNIDLAGKSFVAKPGKTPKDVNLQGFKNLYYIAGLQRGLEIDPVQVQRFPAGSISAADVYDTTNTMLAELVRIKIALGITSPRDAIQVIDGKKPSDVLAQMRLIGLHLQTLISNQKS